MFLSLQNKTIAEIEIVRLIIKSHSDLADTVTAEKRNGIKVYAVSSSVTRLYAIYESFIETAISDYLDSLSEFKRFSSLSSSLKEEYRNGISYILGKVNQGRYRHLNHENIVRWYYEALSDKENYKFISDALIRHEQNLRLNMVDSLFSRIQLKDFKSWVASHPDIKALYQDDSAITEQFESELKAFIQLRNDAAHGAIDSLEGDERLIRQCEVVAAIVKAASSFLTKSLIKIMEDSGALIHLGHVTESFGENGAFVAKVKKDMEIAEGEKLYFLSNNNCHSQTVGSIMLNDKSVTSIVANNDDYEVGIKCTDAVKKNAQIYKHV
jgi:hypothetical protein